MHIPQRHMLRSFMHSAFKVKICFPNAKLLIFSSLTCVLRTQVSKTHIKNMLRLSYQIYKRHANATQHSKLQTEEINDRKSCKQEPLPKNKILYQRMFHVCHI